MSHPPITPGAQVAYNRNGEIFNGYVHHTEHTHGVQRVVIYSENTKGELLIVHTYDFDKAVKLV